MTRGMPYRDTSRSYITWPLMMDGYHHTGEGGMAVFALVPDLDWRECSVGVAHLLVSSVIVRGQEEIERALWGFSQYDRDRGSAALPGFVAAVCLGTTGGAYHHLSKGYFAATRDDLTPEGQRLCDLLTILYGREPYLVTFLDT